MKLIATFALATICACASTNSASESNTKSSMETQQSCASPWVPAVSATHADVYARPDSTSDVVGTVSTSMGVCALTTTAGYGFRRVKLPNGKEGYIAEDALTNV